MASTMPEIPPGSHDASNRTANGDDGASLDRSSDPRYDQAPLPSPPVSAAPAHVQDSPRTAFDTSELRERVDGVLQSDIGVNTLLNRLKQSIASARDFSYFLKERSALEEKHAQGLKKLCRGTHELIRRPESRQGSYAQSYEEITAIHDRMADHGVQFALSAHQMSDDLQEVAANIERERKHWKHTGLSAEQRLQDAEAATAKAKTKYDLLAEQYDRARTGDRQSGRFGLKTKSAAQQEEDLNRKVQAADAEYAAKVQAAQASRKELITSLRPQTVRALTELIMECDSAVTLQLQKFAALNEKLLLGNGLCVSPLKTQPSGAASNAHSLREVAHHIDNDKDFRDYILSFSNKAGTRTSEIKYEKHPALSSSKPAQAPSQPPLQLSNPPTNAPSNQQQGQPGPQSGFQRGYRPLESGQISGVTTYQPPNRDGPPTHMHNNQYPSGPSPPSHSQTPNYLGAQIPQITPHSPLTMSATNLDATDEGARGPPSHFGGAANMRPGFEAGVGPVPGPTMNTSPQYREDFQPMPQQASDNHFRSASQTQPPIPHVSGNPGHQFSDIPGQQLNNHANQQFSNNLNQRFMPPANTAQPRRPDGPFIDLPPMHPVFGITLDELFRRDGNPVPSIVYQCTTAVELFGLDVEGIYRTSGSNPHIMELKAVFDNDSTQIDFRNPATFHHDINSVTTLLKHFLRDLPDPLLTTAHYHPFLEAARHDDDIARRDNIHAIINALPDPNYATLRQLAIHLYRVTEHAQQNRMTASNLAIVFGPTLMGGVRGGDVRDAGWQAKVVETIILNTFQIFDDE